MVHGGGAPGGAGEGTRRRIPFRSFPASLTPCFGLSAPLTHSPPAEAQGAHVPPQDEPDSPALLTKVQESLYGYWDTAKATAQDLYRKTYLPTVDEKIRDMYSKSTAAVTIYAGIFTDQVLSLLTGDH
uniref:Apolipoprotein C-II n=1 Tax=Sus scrofa TaxID=9823 RepID=A0A4X1W446_PIG